jgi:hypothetical protein
MVAKEAKLKRGEITAVQSQGVSDGVEVDEQEAYVCHSFRHSTVTPWVQLQRQEMTCIDKGLYRNIIPLWAAPQL